MIILLKNRKAKQGKARKEGKEKGRDDRVVKLHSNYVRLFVQR